MKGERIVNHSKERDLGRQKERTGQKREQKSKLAWNEEGNKLIFLCLIFLVAFFWMNTYGRTKLLLGSNLRLKTEKADLNN